LLKNRGVAARKKAQVWDLRKKGGSTDQKGMKTGRGKNLPRGGFEYGGDENFWGV